MDDIINNLFKELSGQKEIEAIALGGSRVSTVYDEKSDYDVYLYCNDKISDDVRKKILSKYCSHMELGNHFWEYEDNCILKNDIDIDLVYRNLDEHIKTIENVVEQHQASNGHSTCMWHNLITCKIIYDKNGKLAKAKERFNVKYPAKLKQNIIKRNMRLLHDSMPAYDHQISKAVARDDKVNLGNRVTAFMDSYFDIIFALNEITHPGEKRLVQKCKEQCKILPNNFEENINELFENLYTNPEKIDADVSEIIEELEKVIKIRKIKA